MYEYRKLTPEQRAELVRQRRALGHPPHSPPHLVHGQSLYLLTAACYEHRHHMLVQRRREQVLDELFELFVASGVELRAWVILPNHYHLLVCTPDFAAVGAVLRMVHGRTARAWNLEDGEPGRQVWYRFSDRAMRFERHCYTTLNYIHYNPVKHRWVPSPYSWNESSLHWYLDHYGREWLRTLWVNYPIRTYGRGWDDCLECRGLRRGWSAGW
ncbi:MAG: transposase [Ardenticatenaceae bacterium]|nr:transposase [Ardenticatenaceae bacterium]